MWRVIPGRTAIAALAALAVAVFVALALGADDAIALRVTVAALGALVVLAVLDYVISLRAWRRAAPTLTRQLPPAFAIGVKKTVGVTIATQGGGRWRGALYDHADGSLMTGGLPMALRLEGGKEIE